MVGNQPLEPRAGRTVEFPVPERSKPILARIRSEYREMPGLVLTVAQAQRLFGIPDADGAPCETLLDVLVRQGFLRRTTRGSYCLRSAV